MMKFRFGDISEILESLGFERSSTTVKKRVIHDVEDFVPDKPTPPTHVQTPAYVFTHEDGKTKIVCKKYKDKDFVDEAVLVGLEAQIDHSGIAPGFSFEKYVMFSTLNCLMGMAKQMHDMSVAVMDHAQFVMKSLIPQAFETPKRRKPSKKSQEHDH
jgi:hypothetical protein